MIVEKENNNKDKDNNNNKSIEVDDSETILDTEYIQSQSYESSYQHSYYYNNTQQALQKNNYLLLRNLLKNLVYYFLKKQSCILPACDHIKRIPSNEKFYTLIFKAGSILNSI